MVHNQFKNATEKIMKRNEKFHKTQQRVSCNENTQICCSHSYCNVCIKKN